MICQYRQTLIFTLKLCINFAGDAYPGMRERKRKRERERERERIF